MIKDLIVNATVGEVPDVAGPYAISIAQLFQAHLAAVAFAYDPMIPPTIMGGIPASMIDEQRAENERGRAMPWPSSTRSRGAKACRLNRASSARVSRALRRVSARWRAASISR